jgi:hypothetical protein
VPWSGIQSVANADLFHKRRSHRANQRLEQRYARAKKPITLAGSNRCVEMLCSPFCRRRRFSSSEESDPKSPAVILKGFRKLDPCPPNAGRANLHTSMARALLLTSQTQGSSYACPAFYPRHPLASTSYMWLCPQVSRAQVHGPPLRFVSQRQCAQEKSGQNVFS